MATTDQARTANIEHCLNDYKAQNKTRTLSVMYRGELISLPVMRLPTSGLLFNHDNNRLSAQLDGHPDKALVHGNPTSSESQGILRDLLAKTEDFKELKLQLKNLSQQEPGLATSHGLLINGNTRLAALMDLEQEGFGDGIDVAILPSGTTPEDLLDIEMTLQMTNLVHQDYSFTNELLMMKRYKDSGKTNKELATKMAWLRRGEKKAIQFLRILSTIEEVRTVSVSILPYAVFDAKKQLLLDLDEKYEALKDSGDLVAAEALKWSRFTAMFLGINKDQVRAINEDFFQDKLLNKRLKGDESKDLKGYLDGFQAQNKNSDSAGIFDDSEPVSQGTNIRALFADLINSETVRDDLNIKKDLDGYAAQLSKEIRLASNAKIAEENHSTMMLEPARILKEVRLQLEEIKTKIPEVSSAEDFKSGAFEYEVNKLIKVTQQVAHLTKKYL